MMENYEKTSILMVIGLIALGGIMVYLLLPLSNQDNTYFLNSGSSSGNATESTECINLADNTQIIKNSTSGNCFVRTIIGSGDISVSNTSNTIIVDFNGTTGSESTICYNIGGATLIIKNSTSGNCYVKSLSSGTGISITNGTNTITITNSGVINNSCSSGISCSGTNPSNFTNTSPESTQCINIGVGSKPLIKNSTSGNCYVRTFSPVVGITMSGGDTISINSFCNSIGSETVICTNTSSSHTNEIRSLKAGTGIILSNTSSVITITNNVTDTNTHLGQTVFVVYSSKTMTNIGTTYVDIYNTAFDIENMNVIDCAGVTSIRITVIWDFVGVGTQSIRWVDVNNNSNVLFEDTGIAVDLDALDSGWIAKPSWCTGLVTIEQQGKSATAGDDPVAKGYMISTK